MILSPSTRGDTFNPATISWVMDEQRMQHMLSLLSTCTEIVTDLETTGLDEWETGRPHWPVPARVSMASLTLPQQDNPLDPNPPTFVVPLSHPEGPWSGQWRVLFTRLAEAIRRSGKPLTNHNLKFDLKWINATTRVDLSNQFYWDTQIAAHLLDENASTKLKEVVPRIFGIDRWDDADLSTPGASEKVPLYDLGVYAARDTYWCWRLAVWQRSLMAVGAEGEDAPPPMSDEESECYRLGTLATWCAMPTSKTLTQIEQRGMGVDREWIEAQIGEESAREAAAYSRLVDRYPRPKCSDHLKKVDNTCDVCRLAGDPSFAPTSLWFKTWTSRAVDAGDLVVAATTPNGSPQWSKSVLKQQSRKGSEVATTLLEYREATKRLEFLRSWLKFITPQQTIHTTYNAGRVLTGRLSSSDPNVQQITSKLKPAFIPPEGYLIAELDYSQIELRVAAGISGCEPMIQAYIDGKDLHQMIAADINRIQEDEVTKAQRQGGKAGNFGFLYGMSAEGFQVYALDVYGVDFSLEESHRVRHSFFTKWDGIEDWHRRAVNEAHRFGQVASPLGRVRRVPHIWSSNTKTQAEAERQAINSPVQGMASDFMQMAGASISGNLPGHSPVPDVLLVGTVHDSILALVPEDDWQRAVARCMRRMIDVPEVAKRMGCRFEVPLAVEAKVGTRWGLGDVGIIE